MNIRYCIAPALLGLFLSLTACVEKTPVVEETAPAIKILKGEMMLPPTGGEDAFLFESENEVKAVADYPSWCHVTVGQGRINVKVDDYDGIESRYSGVTLTAADQQFRLTVQQSGIIVALDNKDINLDNKPDNVSLAYETNYPISFESHAEWLHVNADEQGSLAITVDENETKDYRKGYVAYNCGTYKDSVAVVQFNPVDAGMMGDYDWVFTNAAGRQMTYFAFLDLETEPDEEALENGELFYLGVDNGNSLVCDLSVKMEVFRMYLPLGRIIGTYTARGIDFTVVPLVAYAREVEFSNSTHKGYYPFDFEKGEDGKWIAKPDHSAFVGDYFMFSTWEKADLSGTSYENSIIMNDLVLKQL